jgi:hypothetical protein
MPLLPNVDLAIVAEAKIVDCPLSHEHPRGLAKARFLATFGFHADEWQVLFDAIRDYAAVNEVTTAFTSRHGTRFEIDGPMRAPDGRAPVIRVEWYFRAGENAARLVTLVPRRIARR